MRWRLGRYRDALADFEQARAAAAAQGDALLEAEVLLDEATALDWLADYEASRQRAAQAAELSPDKPPRALRARLYLARGRSLHRFCHEEEALVLLSCALAAAEGVSGGEAEEDVYETRVSALLLLGYIQQGLARLNQAADALDRVVSLCEAHGDRLHLAAAFNARAMLAALRGDKACMVSDFERVLALSRELGQDSLEVAAHYNLGECLYLWDDLDGAGPHVERALAAEARRAGGEPRPLIELLAARLDLYRGELEKARERALAIRLLAGGALPVPAEDVLCAMVELAADGADDAAWDALEQRSSRFSIGQERIEVIEARALSALREDRVAEAQRHLARAIEAARLIPNVMAGRLARRAAEAGLCGSGRA
jgi:tetratricopeptide (TPR) repeat protein